MKVMIISSSVLTAPPANYGGLEAVAYNYAKGLTDLGHDVTLVAPKGSSTRGVKLMQTVDPWDSIPQEKQREYAKMDRVWNGWRAQEEVAYQMYKDSIPEYDVIGDHSWSKYAWLSTKDEVVGTCHSMKPYNSKPPRQYPLVTAVSTGHARFITSTLRIPCRSIQNPIDVVNLPFEKDKGERILSLNRIMATKGIHLFLEMVEKNKFKADVAGDDSKLVPDQNYVNWIKQRCAQSAYAVYHGLVDNQKKIQLLQRAKCVICLKDQGYEEIFGLQAAEALACGTPVIALNSWGFADIIDHGRNGYLANSMDEVAKYIGEVDKIKPEDCRISSQRFDIEPRSKAYAHLLQSVKNGSRW